MHLLKFAGQTWADMKKEPLADKVLKHEHKYCFGGQG